MVLGPTAPGMAAEEEKLADPPFFIVSGISGNTGDGLSFHQAHPFKGRANNAAHRQRRSFDTIIKGLPVIYSTIILFYACIMPNENGAPALAARSPGHGA